MKLIVHGGFFSESQTNREVKQAKQNALREIVQTGYKHLQSHTALQTAVYTVSMLEDCDLFNAGTGSQLQSDGKIRMSASVMDGKTQRFAAVINIEDVKNPICIAEKLLPYDDRVLSGRNALSFARNNGVTYYNPETTHRRHEYEKKLSDSIRLGTVGCVVMDVCGHIAAATSTGGKGFEMPGRVSASPTVAANYANSHAGVSCTGIGEDLMSAAVAVKIATRVTDGFSLHAASDKTLAELQAYKGVAGIIAIAANGDIYHDDTYPYMVWALHDGDDVEVFD